MSDTFFLCVFSEFSTFFFEYLIKVSLNRIIHEQMKMIHIIIIVYIYTFFSLNTYIHTPIYTLYLLKIGIFVPNFQTISFVPKRLETWYFRPFRLPQEDTNAWLARSGDEEPARNRKYAWGTQAFFSTSKNGTLVICVCCCCRCCCCCCCCW